MNFRPALLALAVIATLAACGKKDEPAVAAPATPATDTKPVKAPDPLARFRGQAIMGKDGYGLTVCGDTQQRIVTFKPAAQAVVDGFVAGGAKEFFLDGWGTDIDNKPVFESIERIYTEGPACDEKDLGMALFRVKGNEPSWALDVTPSGITLQRPDAENATAEYQPLEKAADGTRHFVGDTQSGKLELTLTPGKCSDGMSDTVYGWNATATIEQTTLKGCGYSGLVSE